LLCILFFYLFTVYDDHGHRLVNGQSQPSLATSGAVSEIVIGHSREVFGTGVGPQGIRQGGLRGDADVALPFRPVARFLRREGASGPDVFDELHFYRWSEGRLEVLGRRNGPGPYLFELESDWLVPQRVLVRGRRLFAEFVAQPGPQGPLGEFELRASGAVRVSVLAPDGTPGAGALVALALPSETRSFESPVGAPGFEAPASAVWRADASGQLELDGLDPLCEYRVSCLLPCASGSSAPFRPSGQELTVETDEARLLALRLVERDDLEPIPCGMADRYGGLSLELPEGLKLLPLGEATSRSLALLEEQRAAEAAGYWTCLLRGRREPGTRLTVGLRMDARIIESWEIPLVDGCSCWADLPTHGLGVEYGFIDLSLSWPDFRSGSAASSGAGSGAVPALEPSTRFDMSLRALVRRPDGSIAEQRSVPWRASVVRLGPLPLGEYWLQIQGLGVRSTPSEQEPRRFVRLDGSGQTAALIALSWSALAVQVQDAEGVAYSGPLALQAIDLGPAPAGLPSGAQVVAALANFSAAPYLLEGLPPGRYRIEAPPGGSGPPLLEPMEIELAAGEFAALTLRVERPRRFPRF
jgi:hypothetical protein